MAPADGGPADEAASSEPHTNGFAAAAASKHERARRLFRNMILCYFILIALAIVYAILSRISSG
jgi:hypothetical protein